MSPSIRADPAARTLNVDSAKVRVRSVITTVDPDRAGDVVVPTGIHNLDEFMLNPIVLWAHNRSSVPPVGVCEWLDIQPRRVVAQTKFAEGIPFAEDLFRLYEQNIGLLTPIIAEQLVRALERYPREWIEDAIGESVAYNRRN